MLFTFVLLKCLLFLMFVHMSYGRAITGQTGGDQSETISYPCPRQCRCHDHIVECNALQLSKVPNNIPNRTRILYLNHNAIENIDIKALSNLQILEELHLRGNKIHSISKDVHLLPKLKHLDLVLNPLWCDCELLTLVTGATVNRTKLVVNVQETKCTQPAADIGRKASDVLTSLQCKNRVKRHTDYDCGTFTCDNGGTCVDDKYGPYCNCPQPYTGERCNHGTSSFHDEDDGEDGPDGNPFPSTLTINLERITYDTISVSWTIRHGISVGSYRVWIQFSDSLYNDPLLTFWTQNTRYTFEDLHPGTNYKVCVLASSLVGVSDQENEIGQDCEFYRTYSYPSHPEPEHPSPSEKHRPPPNREEKETDKEIIHQAAVILGSIIGVCAILIICLTLVYRYRGCTSHPSRSSRETTPVAHEATESTSNANSASHEIIVVSFAPDENATAPPQEDLGATAPDTTSDPPVSNCSLNKVLLALQKGSGNMKNVSPSNTVVLYRPENRARTEENVTRQETASGNAPIYIVADGNHYSLDPTHSIPEVFRSAFSDLNPQCDSLPDDPPPPPYSSTCRDEEETSNVEESNAEAGYDPNDTCDQDDASLVQKYDVKL